MRDAAGEPMTSVSGAKPGADVTIRFRDGEVGARITGEGARAAPAAPRTAPKRKRGTDDDQGTLL
ncbi:hypothetical protein D3C83_324050 [compost metagenome]